MKTTFTLMAAFAALTIGALAAPTIVTAPAEAGVVTADEKTVNLDLTGLVWASGCKKKAQDALKAVTGVSKAVVTKGKGDDGKAVVTCQKSVKVKDLIKALKDAGYGATEAT